MSRLRSKLRTLLTAAALLTAGQAGAEGLAYGFSNAADFDSCYLVVEPASTGVVDLGISRTLSSDGGAWQVKDWTASHPDGSVANDTDSLGNAIPVSDAILMEGAAVQSGDFHLLARLDIAAPVA